MCVCGGGGGAGVRSPPGKSQVAIFSLKKLVRNPHEKQLDPIMGPIASRGSSVRPSVKYVNEKKKKKKKSGPPLRNFLDLSVKS